MPVLKKKIKEDFTVVHNVFVRDSQLGISARGILITMLSMNENWHFSIKGLAAILPDGERKVSTALQELEKFGYLQRRRIYKDGKVCEWEYLFSDEPIFKKDPETSHEEPSPETSTPETSNIDHSESLVHENLHRRNVDVGFVDIEPVDLENHHDYKISNNKISNNQVSLGSSINPINLAQAQNERKKADSIDRMDEMEQYRQLVHENVSFDALVANNPIEADSIYELTELMVEVLITKKPTLRIAQEELPSAVVKARLLKLDETHIAYVLECLKKNTTNVRNIRAYLLTALYNAPTTMNSYYQSTVNYNMYGTTN